MKTREKAWHARMSKTSKQVNNETEKQVRMTKHRKPAKTNGRKPAETRGSERKVKHREKQIERNTSSGSAKALGAAACGMASAGSAAGRG